MYLRFSLALCLFAHFLVCNSKNALQVGQLREVSNKANNAELKLFLEVEFGQVVFFSHNMVMFPMASWKTSMNFFWLIHYVL